MATTTWALERNRPLGSPGPAPALLGTGEPHVDPLTMTSTRAEPSATTYTEAMLRETLGLYDHHLEGVCSQ